MLNSASINIYENYTLVEPNFELTNFVLYQIRIKETSLFSLLVRLKSGIKIVVHDVLGRKIFEKAMIYKVTMIITKIFNW
jgi:hypothetical protein